MIYRIPLSLQDLPIISLDLAIELELAATTSARMTASHAPPTRYLHISHFSLLSTSECLGQWVSYQRDGDRGSRRRWLNISFQVMTRCRVSPNRSLCPPGARWPVDLHTDSFRFLHFRMRFLLRRRAGLHKSIDLSAACRRFCSHWTVC